MDDAGFRLKSETCKGEEPLEAPNQRRPNPIMTNPMFTGPMFRNPMFTNPYNLCIQTLWIKYINAARAEERWDFGFHVDRKTRGKLNLPS